MFYKFARASALLAYALLCLQCAPVDHTAARLEAPPLSHPKAYAQKRLAAVVIGYPQKIQFPRQINYQALKKSEAISFGSACPITYDGYFLTANHVITKKYDQQLWVLCQKNNSLQRAQPRVIWKNEKIDLALIHCPLQTPSYFPLRHHESSKGSLVYNAGIASIHSWKKGILQETVPARPSSTKSHFFPHSYDVVFGDSGGAVMNSAGELVGIHSHFKSLSSLHSIYFKDSVSIRPLVPFIQKIIRSDRSQQNR